VATTQGTALPASGAEIVQLDAVAVRASIELVDRVTPADLNRPTPCAAWTLYGLLAHMATQHHGFAAAAEGHDGPEPWKLRIPGADLAGSYRTAAALAVARAVPAGQARLVPGAAFAPTVPGAAGDTLGEIVALLGRSPTWPG
jgi:Mycothiol maleylpyruvate isomerase N-terminal domain